MCSTFSRGCGFHNSTLILIRDVYCPNTKCSGKHCLHKKTFQSLGRSNYQCPQCASVCKVRNILFEDQTKSSFLSLGQGVYSFEEAPKSIQDAIGDVYCPGKYCFNREKCESVDGYVTTPRSIRGCGKRGAWSFVYEVHFRFYPISIYTQQVNFFQLTVNLHKIIMIFSVFNDGIQWTLDFCPDSVTIAVIDLDQNKTISSQEIPLVAWQLHLSQKPDFLNIHLPRVPILRTKREHWR